MFPRDIFIVISSIHSFNFCYLVTIASPGLFYFTCIFIFLSSSYLIWHALHQSKYPPASFPTWRFSYFFLNFSIILFSLVCSSGLSATPSLILTLLSSDLLLYFYRGQIDSSPIGQRYNLTQNTIDQKFYCNEYRVSNISTSSRHSL